MVLLLCDSVVEPLFAALSDLEMDSLTDALAALIELLVEVLWLFLVESEVLFESLALTDCDAETLSDALVEVLSEVDCDVVLELAGMVA